MPHGQRLPSRAFGADDYEFRLGLDPETRRVIGQVGQQSDKRCSRSVANEAVGQFTIKVRNHREHQVRRMLGPVRSQEAYHAAVSGADRALEEHKKLGCEPCPALSQDQVVNVFNMEAGGTAHDIQGSEQFLNVEKANIPGYSLGGEFISEGLGRTAMASAGVMENDGQLSQEMVSRVIE